MKARDKRDDANYESVAYWRSETAETRVQLEYFKKQIAELLDSREKDYTDLDRAVMQRFAEKQTAELNALIYSPEMSKVLQLKEQAKQIAELKDILEDIVFEADPKTGTGSGIENYTWDKIKQALK